MKSYNELALEKLPEKPIELEKRQVNTVIEMGYILEDFILSADIISYRIF